jgi:hypothetical protein
MAASSGDTACSDEWQLETISIRKNKSGQKWQCTFNQWFNAANNWQHNFYLDSAECKMTSQPGVQYIEQQGLLLTIELFI